MAKPRIRFFGFNIEHVVNVLWTSSFWWIFFFLWVPLALERLEQLLPIVSITLRTKNDNFLICSVCYVRLRSATSAAFSWLSAVTSVSR